MIVKKVGTSKTAAPKSKASNVRALVCTMSDEFWKALFSAVGAVVPAALAFAHARRRNRKKPRPRKRKRSKSRPERAAPEDRHDSP